VRIVSLVPHATELLFALGLGDQVVGVTHECDYPAEAAERPHLTQSVLPAGLSAAEIDAAVRERTERGEAIYELDVEELHELEPDLIVTQELCPVCAVSYEEVLKEAEKIASCPKVVALDPKSFGETIGDIKTVAAATGAKEAAFGLVAASALRVDRVKASVAGAHPVAVACLEWLDPVFVAGHWTPQLVEWAGGVDVLGFPAEPSERVTWEQVAAAHPEVVVVMPCGYDAWRSLEEAERYASQLAALEARRVVAVDASAYFSRPGPRLVDGLELLAHILHPERLPEPPPGAEALDVELTPLSR
jgi:iron complex transport system substrate-binding protein